MRVRIRIRNTRNFSHFFASMPWAMGSSTYFVIFVYGMVQKGGRFKVLIHLFLNLQKGTRKKLIKDLKTDQLIRSIPQIHVYFIEVGLFVEHWDSKPEVLILFYARTFGSFPVKFPSEYDSVNFFIFALRFAVCSNF
jgi:hypothetical protein